MNNIVIAGLINDTNLGDQVIYECTRNMIEEILGEKGLCNIELRGIDISGSIVSGLKTKNTRIANNSVRTNIKNLLKRIVKKTGININSIKRYYLIERNRKSTLLQCKRFIDNDTIAIIFAGGGLIKYKYQDLPHHIDVILRFADRLGIPVMLSATGVEGYEKNNKECKRLKKALNRKCVKLITTRDDISLLNKSYITNSSTITARVADPACSFARYYTPKVSKKKCIGVGTVREGLFIDNGIDFKKQQMIALWNGICNELESRGYNYRLFTNGLKEDYAFAEELAEGKDIISERPRSASDLADTIYSFDAVIVGRLHASIVAYSYGIPGVGLVWNDKQKMFGECIGFPERFITVDKFDAKDIVDAMEKAISEGYNESARAQYCATTKAYLEMFVDIYACGNGN